MESKVEMETKSKIKEEDVFNNKYFIFNKKLLKSVGLWPYQNVWFKIFMGILYVVCIYSMMIPQVIRAFEEWYSEIVDLAIIVESISGVVLYVAVLARLLTLTLQESKMRCIYEDITRDWEEINDSGERAVLQRCCNIGRILSIFYTVYCHVTVSIFVWTPALAPMILNTFLNTTYKKSICIYAEYFVDQDEYFYYIFCHTVLCAIFGTMLFTAFDSTFMAMVQHAVGLLKVLKYRLNESSKIFDLSGYSCKDNTIIHKYLLNCIIMHNKSLQFIEVIDNTYDLYHFFLYSCLLSGFSIFTIDVVINIHNYFALIRLLPCWFAIIVYMFYFNWPGQKIIDTSEEVFAAIYLSNWYHFPLKTQKLITFMLLRSVNPIFLKASIFEMSFKTCGMIMNTAMSYITVFISLL